MKHIEFRLAGLNDLEALETVGDNLFDHPIKPDRAREFLADPRHHLYLAWDESKIVGMASGFHYVHPDKEPAMFVNEVGVVDEYQNRGIGRTLVRLLCEYALELGCHEAWVATDKENIPAQRAYVAAGGKIDEQEFISYSYPLINSNRKG